MDASMLVLCATGVAATAAQLPWWLQDPCPLPGLQACMHTVLCTHMHGCAVHLASAATHRLILVVFEPIHRARRQVGHGAAMG